MCQALCVARQWHAGLCKSPGRGGSWGNGVGRSPWGGIMTGPQRASGPQGRQQAGCHAAGQPASQEPGLQTNLVGWLGWLAAWPLTGRQAQAADGPGLAAGRHRQNLDTGGPSSEGPGGLPRRARAGRAALWLAGLGLVCHLDQPSSQPAKPRQPPSQATRRIWKAGLVTALASWLCWMAGRWRGWLLSWGLGLGLAGGLAGAG